MKFFYSIILIFICINSYTQLNLDQFYNSDFKPAELNNSSIDRIKEHELAYRANYPQDQISDNDLNDFALNHSFYFEKLNKSGNVFFGDEISVYLNDLKDYLLANNNRKDFITVYLVNFPQLNAFTNDFGSIYINIGTIAKVKSEPQLLAILAHEISHVLLRHSLKEKTYLDSISYASLKNNYGEFETHYFNQKQELEADSLCFKLLIQRNIDLSSVGDLFNLLDQNSNPTHNNPLYFSSVFGNNQQVKEYLDFIEKTNRDTLFKRPVYLTIYDDYEISTHPSAYVRKSKFLMLNWTKSDSINYFQTSKFALKNRLSSFVFLNTLITDGQYIDALYLACNLLYENPSQPENDYLERKKLKILLLLTQHKYRMLSEDIIINNHGNECLDSRFYDFRRNILSISPTEMNMLTCLAIKDYLKLNSDPYVERMLDFSYQFLYRNNSNLFRNDGQQIIPIHSVFVEDKIGEWKSLLGYQSADEATRLVNLKNRNYVLVDRFIPYISFDTVFLSGLRNSNTDLMQFNNAIRHYKLLRTQFESTVALNQFPTTINPLVAKKRVKKSTFTSKTSISPTSNITLFESLCISYEGKKEMIINVNLKETLEFEEHIQKSVTQNKFFSNNLSGLLTNIDKTVKTNYLHKCLLIRLEESFLLEDLFYSSVDEELQSFLKENPTDYFALNMNYSLKNKKKGKKRSNVFYTLFFESNTGSIAYVSTVLSKKNSNAKTLDYILNLSFKNHVY